jgi:hypothetical protein
VEKKFMTLDEGRLYIPQYLSGDLTPAESRLFEEQLAVSAELRIELEELRSLWNDLALLPEQKPSPALRAQFYQKLNKLAREGTVSPDSSSSKAKRFHLSGWHLGTLPQLAAGLLIFVLGLYVGRDVLDNRTHVDEMAQMRSQVQGLREMVALSLLERQSATSRLEGVSWSSQVDQPNSELLTALFTTLNNDANVNVRLSSVDALEKFNKNATVTQSLIDSIQRQDSPLVQIALIDALVRIRDHAAAEELKKLKTDTKANPSVRKRAQWGLQKLNYE